VKAKPGHRSPNGSFGNAALSAPVAIVDDVDERRFARLRRPSDHVDMARFQLEDSPAPVVAVEHDAEQLDRHGRTPMSAMTVLGVPALANQRPVNSARFAQARTLFEQPWLQIRNPA